MSARAIERSIIAVPLLTQSICTSHQRYNFDIQKDTGVGLYWTHQFAALCLDLLSGGCLGRDRIIWYSIITHRSPKSSNCLFSHYINQKRYRFSFSTMVKVGDFSLQLVDATTKEPFKEHVAPSDGQSYAGTYSSLFFC